MKNSKTEDFAKMVEQLTEFEAAVANAYGAGWVAGRAFGSNVGGVIDAAVSATENGNV